MKKPNSTQRRFLRWALIKKPSGISIEEMNLIRRVNKDKFYEDSDIIPLNQLRKKFITEHIKWIENRKYIYF